MLPSRGGRGPWRGHAGGLPARHLRSGTGSRVRHRRGGMGCRRLQRGYGRSRASASSLGVGLADKAELVRDASCSPSGVTSSTTARVAVPSAANTLLTNLTFVILTALVAPFGAEALAGYGGRRAFLEYLLIPGRWFSAAQGLVPLVVRLAMAAGDVVRVSSG